MKKILLLFCLTMAISNTFAQKTYVKVYSSDLGGSKSAVFLRGNVPTDMQMEYKCDDDIISVYFMDIVNMLAERGYEVEFTMDKSNFLMSKISSGGYNAVRGVELNEDEDVTEVARYNLQGLPVKEHDKGAQIIVYSNYTTKTVIVQ